MLLLLAGGATCGGKRIIWHRYTNAHLLRCKSAPVGKNLSPDGAFKKQHNFFLPTLNAYGINVRLLLAALGA